LSPKLLCQLAGYGTALTMLILPFARTLTLLQTCFFFYGLFDGVFITTSNYSRINCLSTKQRAVAFGLSAGCTAIFAAMGPPLAGE
jgi:sugar phosphate permease